MSLHAGLITAGIDSHVAVQNRSRLEEPRIHQLPGGNLILDRVINAVTFRLGWDGITGTRSFNLLRTDYFKSADVINLHALHGGYFNLLAVRKMAKIKPVVLTLHDMWHFTGHCVYSMDCDRWKTGCGSCPYLDTYPGVQRDATAFNLRTRTRIFAQPNIHLVAISSWMETLLHQSILKDRPIHRIPNGIDTDVYRPYEKASVRHKWSLPQDKTIILCCASDLSDHRKGMDLLVRALGQIGDLAKRSILLVIMGNASEVFRNAMPVDCHCVGFLTSDQQKAEVFSACDVLAFPTRADNLPVVIQEVMSCGVPCISFDVGGVADMVRPGVTGWLCQSESIEQFVAALTSVVNDNNSVGRLSEKCRSIALAEYSLQQQGLAYRKLFEAITEKSELSTEAC